LWDAAMSADFILEALTTTRPESVALRRAVGSWLRADAEFERARASFALQPWLKWCLLSLAVGVCRQIPDRLLFDAWAADLTIPLLVPPQPSRSQWPRRPSPTAPLSPPDPHPGCCQRCHVATELPTRTGDMETTTG
jgi:hypothetical protein